MVVVASVASFATSSLIVDPALYLLLLLRMVFEVIVPIGTEPPSLLTTILDKIYIGTFFLEYSFSLLKMN